MMGVGAKRALGLYRSCAPRHRFAGFQPSESLVPSKQRGVGNSGPHLVAETVHRSATRRDPGHLRYCQIEAFRANPTPRCWQRGVLKPHYLATHSELETSI